MPDIFDEVEAAPKDIFDEADSSMPPITLSPYDRYRLAGGEKVSGPFGPANPQEVLSLPDILKVPAAAIEATGIPQAIEDVGADFLRRTGIDPSVQPGESLAPGNDKPPSYPPSPLEEAFPKATQGIENAIKSLITPGTAIMAPLVAFKPVQLGFQAQMAAGVPQQLENVITEPTTEGKVQAGAQAALGLLAGAHRLLPKATREAAQAIQREPEVETVPPTVTAGEAPQQAPSVGSADSGEATTSPREPANPESKPVTTTPQDGVDSPVVTTVTEPPTAETQAVQKVEAQVEKIARTAGQRPAKDVKAELVARLKQAINDAPNAADVEEKSATKASGETYISQPDSRTKITIDIPGDGTFTVWNTKENLTDLLGRAKSIKTDSKPEPTIKTRGISKEDREFVAQQLANPETAAISQGPGAASPGDVPAAPRQALAAAGRIENAPPEERPLGPVSPMSIALNNTHNAIANIGTFIKGLAGESMPKTTAANRLVGESGVRYAASRIAAQPLARTFAYQVLEGTGVDPLKFGAALTEDNLRSIRESLRQKVTEYTAEGKADLATRAQEQADNVASIIGSKGSPFKTEDEYFDFLAEPSTQEAVARHIQMWQEVIDPQYRQSASIDPDTPLPSRGQQTGARVNLHALFPEDPAAHPIKGKVGSNLTATFKKKSPFAILARGSGLAYDIDYHSIIGNTFERQLEIANKNHFDNQLLANGLAVIDRPGQQVIINGKPAVGFPLSRRMVVATKEGETKTFSQAHNIYVDQDLAREYRSASNLDPKFRIPLLTPVMNALNRAALAGLTDATVHVSNQLTAIFNRPLTGKLFTDTLLSATGRADVPVALIQAITKAFGDNQEQLAKLAKIGAMRADDIHFGFFGRALQFTDKVTRLVLDDAFKNLVDQKLVENTDTARREYVNQIGQYNRRLQGPLTKLLRDTGFGPFVTAGKTFNALGVKMATLSPGVKAANNFAAVALRVNVLSKWIGMAVLAGTLNYLLTRKLKNGGVLGRPGTPIGSVDTGTNDKSGKQQSFPLANVLGLGRGLRVTGIGGAINSKRLGLTNADAAQSAARDIINSWTAPAAGPPVKFAAIGATGYPPAVNVGRSSKVVPPGQVQLVENVKEALLQASPLVQTYVKYRQGKSTPEILSSQIPRFTMTPGKTESMVEKYPRIVSLAQGNAFIDDMIHQARQLPRDKRPAFVIEQAKRLPVEQRTHAMKEAIRRKVYTN